MKSMFYYSLKFNDKPYNFIGSNHAVYTDYDGWGSIIGLITLVVDKLTRSIYFNDQNIYTDDFQTEVSDDFICIEIINDNPVNLDIVFKHKWDRKYSTPPGYRYMGFCVYLPFVKVNHKGIRVFQILIKKCRRKYKNCHNCFYLDVCDVSHSVELDMPKVISHFNKSVNLSNDEIRDVRLTLPAVVKTPDMTFFDGKYLYGLRVYIPSPALFQKMIENVKNVIFGDYRREYKFLEDTLLKKEDIKEAQDEENND